MEQDFYSPSRGICELEPGPSERLVFEPTFLLVALPIVTECSERGGEGLPYTRTHPHAPARVCMARMQWKRHDQSHQDVFWCL